MMHVTGSHHFKTTQYSQINPPASPNTPQKINPKSAPAFNGQLYSREGKQETTSGFDMLILSLAEKVLKKGATKVDVDKGIVETDSFKFIVADDLDGRVFSVVDQNVTTAFTINMDRKSMPEQLSFKLSQALDAFSEAVFNHQNTIQKITEESKGAGKRLLEALLAAQEK